MLVKALRDPGLIFKTPDEVLAEKWEYDVRELQVAEEEGMEGAAARRFR
jgi:hypothetical protein